MKREDTRVYWLAINEQSKKFVIPAQAGIQLINKSPRKWDNTLDFVCFAVYFFAGFRPAPE